MGDRGKDGKRDDRQNHKKDYSEDDRKYDRVEKMAPPDPWPDPPKENGDKGDKGKK